LFLIALMVLVLGSLAVNATANQGTSEISVYDPTSPGPVLVPCTFVANPAGFILRWTNPGTGESYVQIARYDMPGRLKKGDEPRWIPVLLELSGTPYCDMGLTSSYAFFKDLIVIPGGP
jgi:hypothetical protein